LSRNCFLTHFFPACSFVFRKKQTHPKNIHGNQLGYIHPARKTKIANIVNAGSSQHWIEKREVRSFQIRQSK
jgi:hypothetical protein